MDWQSLWTIYLRTTLAFNGSTARLACFRCALRCLVAVFSFGMLRLTALSPMSDCLLAAMRAAKGTPPAARAAVSLAPAGPSVRLRKSTLAGG